MRRFLLVGSNFSGLAQYLSQTGDDYIVLKDRLHVRAPDRRLKRRVVCDFSSRAAILQCVDTIKQPIDGVMTIYENYALPAAWIAKHLGLPGMPLTSIEACTDKFLMRQLFAHASEKISPDFALIENEAQLLDFAATHDFPLIIKPANLAKSLLVTKNNDHDELLANYRNTLSHIDAVYRKYAPHRQPRILVEEFMIGSVHSVDAFVDGQGVPHILEHIVDYETGYDVGFDDNFHYSRLLPSRLSPTEQTALYHCGELGVRALGMRNSPAHVEVIMTTEGPRIVEIGARNGGYRARMHRLANGIDLHGAAIELAVGHTPQITATKDEPCAVLELFPKREGTFVEITQEKALRALPSLSEMNVKVEPGDKVGKSSNGYKMCAVVILHHSDQAQFDRDLAWVRQHVRVVVK